MSKLIHQINKFQRKKEEKKEDEQMFKFCLKKRFTNA